MLTRRLSCMSRMANESMVMLVGPRLLTRPMCTFPFTRLFTCCCTSARICSRPGSVPTPTPTVTAPTKRIVRSVKALTMTTRCRRFIELEVRSDREGEGELLVPALPRRQLECRTRRVVFELALGVARVVEWRSDLLDAGQQRHIGVVEKRSLLARVAVPPHVDLHGPHRRARADTQPGRPPDL